MFSIGWCTTCCFPYRYFIAVAKLRLWRLRRYQHCGSPVPSQTPHRRHPGHKLWTLVQLCFKSEKVRQHFHSFDLVMKAVNAIVSWPVHYGNTWCFGAVSTCSLVHHHTASLLIGFLRALYNKGFIFPIFFFNLAFLLYYTCETSYQQQTVYNKQDFFTYLKRSA